MATMAGRFEAPVFGQDHPLGTRSKAGWQGMALKPPAAARPAAVPGPFGKPITFDMLPPAETRRWVVRRKAEVVAAVNGGLLTATEACARYRISPEELELWQKAIDRAGVPGLRVTRIQLYRDDYAEKVGRRAAIRPIATVQ